MIKNEVATLVNEIQNPVSYNYDFDSGKLSLRVYLYRLRAGKFVSSRKRILLKTLS